MRLSKKVWALWGIRLLAANILLYPVASYYMSAYDTPFVLFFSADSVLMIMLAIKYKTTAISMEKKLLHITQGLLLRRSVIIKPDSTCAAKSISTPLCQKLSLCYLVIYCEGVRFFLPPLDNKLASYIEKNCRKR
ncbi:MAG: hypothetical protein IJA62_06925 [Ruminococcus sp.]|nr:hypothetical protein [Ruminococcus sp.]